MASGRVVYAGPQGLGNAGAIVSAVSGIVQGVATAVGSGLSYSAQSKAIQQQQSAADQQSALTRQQMLLDAQAQQLAAQQANLSTGVSARQQQMVLLVGGTVVLALLGVGAVVLLRRGK